LLSNFSGEIAALSAASLWAAASVVYSRLGLKIPPLQLNFYKGIVAIALILITLIIQQASFAGVSLATVVLFALSGVVGIGLGDTAYFAALNTIGARRTLLLETASPPIGALLALIFLKEQLTVNAWCGILLTLIGILTVIGDRAPSVTGDNNSLPFWGIIWAILAAIAQACGAVISRFALLQSDISPLQSTLIRLLGGTAIALMLLIFASFLNTTQPKLTWKLSPKVFRGTAIAAFGSTYLGIWLQQTALKFAPTGIAQTLLATSPLFVLPIVTIMGEKINIRAVLGVLIAVAGISLLFL
jgi:drug/metabolite transporter (DMT)-like permease